MFRPSCKLLLVGMVAAVMISAAASEANAGWYWGYRPALWGYGACPSYACAPCGYTSCCTVSGCDPCCDPCGGWVPACRPGLFRCGLWGARSYAWGCGLSSCCYDSCMSSCTTCGAASCCGGDEGSVVAPSPTRATPPVAPPPAKTLAPVPDTAPKVPAEPPPPGKTPPTLGPFDKLPEPGAPAPADKAPGFTLPGGNTSAPLPENSGLLTISVPYEAKVTINGIPTRSTGSKRQFVSHGLQPGFSYKYEVRASIVRDGQIVEDSRIVYLSAGERGNVAFGFNVKSGEGLASSW
jgi:uncharacterized protein (TIGR03000 family)